MQSLKTEHAKYDTKVKKKKKTPNTRANDTTCYVFCMYVLSYELNKRKDCRMKTVLANSYKHWQCLQKYVFVNNQDCQRTTLVHYTH